MQSRITLQNAENYEKIVSAYQQAQNCSKMGLSDMRYNSRLFNLHQMYNAAMNRCKEVSNRKPCYKGGEHFVHGMPLKSCFEPEFVITRSKLCNRSPVLKELKFYPLELCDDIGLVNGKQYVAAKVIFESKEKKIETPHKVPSWYQQYREAKVSYTIEEHNGIQYGVYVGEKFSSIINYAGGYIQIDLGEIVSENGSEIKRIILHRFPAQQCSYDKAKKISNMLIRYCYNSLQPGSEYLRQVIQRGAWSSTAFEKIKSSINFLHK